MAEDGVVDFGDESLPSVTWEGVDYAAGKWGEEWDTEWDVPAVRALSSHGQGGQGGAMELTVWSPGCST